MNKITLIGNLTADPELRSTQSGISVCSFNIAVNRRFANQDGDRQTDFFRINTWRTLAENCAKFLAKGRKIAVVGELQARIYHAQDGSARLSLDVAADEIEFLTPKEQPKAPDSATVQNGKVVPDTNDTDGWKDINTDELPF